jgi:hypothetical protein
MARISGNDMCYANGPMVNQHSLVAPADSTRVQTVNRNQVPGSIQNAVGQQNQLGQIVDGPQGPSENNQAEFPGFMNKRSNSNPQARQVGTPESRQEKFKTTFGDQSYVKDLADENLLSLLSQVGDICPEVAQKAQNGKLTKSDIATLQTKLEEKGFSVGKAGSDGKFGKDTFSAVSEFLKQKAEAQSQGRPLTV